LEGSMKEDKGSPACVDSATGRDDYCRAILWSLEDEIFVLDRDRLITDVNKDFLPLCGKRKEEVLGRPCHEIALGLDRPCDEAGEPCWFEDAFRTGKTRHFRRHQITRDESRILVDVHLCPLRDKRGRITHLIKRVRDISQEVRLEAQLRQAHKMEAMGTMAAGIAHEFNNILGSIFLNAELALQGMDPEHESGLFVRRILDAGRRARDLVGQILTFGRQGRQERIPVHIVPLVKETLKLLRASLPASVEIRNEITTSTGIIDADPAQIHLVLTHLCLNAAQAMAAEGGGILEVRLEDTEVDAETAAGHPDLHEGSYLRLKVRDNGPGMEPWVLERIFEPFFTTKRVDEGTGMGLALVHGVVRGYDGAVMVKSRPGQGALFEVYLPRAEIGVPDELTPEGPLVGGRERILFVDDEASVTGAAGHVLRRLGYRVTTLTEAEKALESFRNAPEDFDLVITDLTMPRMDGIQLGKAIREIRPDMPIVLCTGYRDVITPEEMGSLGVRELLLKPMTRSRLAAAVRSALGGLSGRGIAVPLAARG